MNLNYYLKHIVLLFMLNSKPFVMMAYIIKHLKYVISISIKLWSISACQNLNTFFSFSKKVLFLFFMLGINAIKMLFVE